MPDPILVLEALAGAALLAAAVLLLCSLPWRTPRPAPVAAGGVLGVGLGFFLGCWVLGLWPHWPPREDQDRLLLLLLPAVLGIELVAAWLGRVAWLVWLLRLVVAAGAARVLLHNTSYLMDLAGPGTREWTPAQTWLILGGLGLALAAVWALQVVLAKRTPSRSLPLALALTCIGAALTVMLSGYSTGGQMGLPLAAALVGTTIASWKLSGSPDMTGTLGVGVVGLFALLVIGRFFGQLTTSHAVLLFGAPLLCWFSELPYVRRLRPGLRGLIQVVLVAVPVAVAGAQAQQKFVEASQPAPGAKEPSIQDYMDFGR